MVQKNMNNYDDDDNEYNTMLFWLVITAILAAIGISLFIMHSV